MAHVRKSSVALRIAGDDLVPDEITKLLCAKPTSAQTKGQEIIGPNTGQVRIATFGMWRLQVKSREPEDMDAQIQEILSQATSDMSVWKSIGERFEIDLFCGIFLGSDNAGMTLSAASLAALGERGIEVALDIYYY